MESAPRAPCRLLRVCRTRAGRYLSMGAGAEHGGAERFGPTQIMGGPRNGAGAVQEGFEHFNEPAFARLLPARAQQAEARHRGKRGRAPALCPNRWPLRRPRKSSLAHAPLGRPAARERSGSTAQETASHMCCLAACSGGGDELMAMLCGCNATTTRACAGSTPYAGRMRALQPVS